MIEESVELKGHIIDSLLLPKVLDLIIARGADPSCARIRIRAQDRAVMDELLASLRVHGAEAIEMEDAQLVEADIYHLDTCFCPLDDRSALYYPPAFDAAAVTVLKKSVPDLLPVSDQSALRFACNAVVVGRTVVTNTGCDDLAAPLAERHYKLRMSELSEFIKSGGSARCLTLNLS